MSQATTKVDAEIGENADTSDVHQMLAHVDGVSEVRTGDITGFTYVSLPGDVPREVFKIARNAGLTPVDEVGGPRRLMLVFDGSEQ